MAFTLTDFKSNLFAANVSGGARPSLFKITISDSSSEYSLNSTESILVKAANIPAANIAGKNLEKKIRNNFLLKEKLKFGRYPK